MDYSEMDFGNPAKMFFDQITELAVEMGKMIESVDVSPPYEVDKSALFKRKDGGYSVICISGCSCWPSRGHTEHFIGKTKEKAIESAVNSDNTEYLTSPKSLKDKMNYE